MNDEVNKVVIGLGSNINPQENIHKAKEFIRKITSIIKESNTIETSPIGMTNQPNFLNTAVVIETSANAHEFKQSLKAIEHKLGRRSFLHDFGPRIIDLDIIIWNGKIVHKDFYERDFLKQLVLEVLPELKY